LICLPIIERYYLVDPWTVYPENWRHVALGPMPQEWWDQVFQDAMGNIQAHKDKATVLRMPSVEAADHVEDASLDMVYIDALHRHSSVVEDIFAWGPKVRDGGIIGGHDYWDEQTPHAQTMAGVKLAVDEFFGTDVRTGDPTALWDHVWLVKNNRYKGVVGNGAKGKERAMVRLPLL
jgi:hypothetical protein